jgi:hypothetical protein
MQQSAQYGQMAQPQQPQQQAAPGFGQPAFGGQAQYGAPQVQTQPQGGSIQQQLSMHPGAIIQPGAGVPPELVGQTVGYALQRYAQMRQQYMAQQQQPQAQQQPQQPAQQQPAQQQRQTSSFWSDPEGTIERIVQSRIGQAVAPFQMQNIEQQMAQQLPAYGQLRSRIAGYIQGLPPEAQTRPEAWQLAHKLAYADAIQAGEQVALQVPRNVPQQVQQHGQTVPQQMPVHVQPQAPQQPQTQYAPPNFVNGNGAQEWQAAFTEQPSQQFQPQNVQLTPQQMAVAERMGITYQDYARATQGMF